MQCRDRSYVTCKKGSNSIEMALVILIVVVLIPPFVDVVDVINAKTKIANAVNVGSKYAIARPNDISRLPDVVKSASALPAENVNVAVNQFCECATVSIACTAPCPTGLATFTRINASYAINLIVDYPAYPNPFPVQSLINVRVQ